MLKCFFLFYKMWYAKHIFYIFSPDNAVPSTKNILNLYIFLFFSYTRKWAKFLEIRKSFPVSSLLYQFLINFTNFAHVCHFTQILNTCTQLLVSKSLSLYVWKKSWEMRWIGTSTFNFTVTSLELPYTQRKHWISEWLIHFSFF